MESQEPNKPVGVALIGCGYWGPNLIRNFSSSRKTRLVAICDRDPARLNAVAGLNPAAAQVTDFQDLLNNPEVEAVAIATPPKTHAPFAAAALNAGKHVLIEKPFCTSTAEGLQLLSLAAERGRTLMVDHTYLYSPAIRKIKSLIDSGELGRLHFFDSVRINLGLFQNDCNVVWDLACHDLAIVSYLIGKSPVSVNATGISHTFSGMEDVAYLTLDYGDNLTATFHVNWLSPVKIRQMIVGGQTKSVVFNDLDPNEPIKVYDRGIQLPDQPESRHGLLVGYRMGDVWSPYLPREEPLRNMVEHFAHSIRTGQKPLSDGQSGLEVVQILEAAQRSMRQEGRRVTIASLLQAAA
jgi:predicted dehydrogenase